MEKLTKVLLITVRADVGGGPEHVFQLARTLMQKVDVYIAAPSDDPYWGKFLSLVGKNRLVKIPHRKFTLNAFIQLHKFIFANDIKLIHSHGKGAGIYSRLIKIIRPKIKVIHTLHGYHDGTYPLLGKKLYAVIERILSKLTFKIINVSQGEREKFLEATGVSKNKCQVIYNGVEVFEPILTNIYDEKKLKLCFLARDDSQKNVEEMEKIYKEAVRLYGEDFLEIDVYGILKESTYTKFPKGIFYKGAKEGLKNILNNYDVLLNTSRWEGMPISVLEAMSENVLVLATNVVGNNDIITSGKNGYLYSLGNISEACYFLEKIYKNDGENKQIKRQAFCLVKEKYSITHMGEKILQLYGAAK